MKTAYSVQSVYERLCSLKGCEFYISKGPENVNIKHLTDVRGDFLNDSAPESARSFFSAGVCAFADGWVVTQRDCFRLPLSLRVCPLPNFRMS